MLGFRRIFRKELPAVIGMIHVQPLPGTPSYVNGSLNETITQAKEEAEIYLECGVDGIMLENMHDLPYMNRCVGPEITSCMTVVSNEVKRLASDVPCGIQILAGCNKEALAVAKAASLDFIRAEGFIFSHIADEGLMNADAGEILRYRKMIDANDILVFSDIKKKHSSHAVTQDLSISDFCHAAKFFLTDGVIITGNSTGQSANEKDVQEAIMSSDLPVLVGSGVTPENFPDFINAHGIIVGSNFKESGFWKNKLSKERVQKFMDCVKKYRHEKS